MHARKQTLVSMFVFVIIYVQYLALSFLVESPCFFCSCRIVHLRIFRREELRKRRQMSGGGKNGKRGFPCPFFHRPYPHFPIHCTVLITQICIIGSTIAGAKKEGKEIGPAPTSN